MKQALLLIAILASTSNAREIFTTFGDDLPQVEKTDAIMGTNLYVASINTEKRCVRWIAYKVHAAYLFGETSLVRNWKTKLPNHSLEHQDFLKSGYDIGHTAPLASFHASPYAFQVNFVDVCAPQTPDLNRGIMLKSENYVRELARRYGVVSVVIESVWDDKPSKRMKNADEDHDIPDAFRKRIRWKDEEGQQHEQIFVMPQNAPRKADLEKYLLLESE